jgi:hypothetical protein
MMRALACVSSLLMMPALGAAQDGPYRPPRVEIGGQIGSLAAIGSEGFYPIFAAGPRVSITLTDRLGLDVLGETMGNWDSDLPWFYYLQGRYTVRPEYADRSAIFLTGGVAGSIREWDIPELRYPNPDGTITVYPGRDGLDIEAPFALVGGLGMQRTFRRYLAFRADGQAMFGFSGGWAMRGSLSLSIPIGRYR